MPVEFDSLAEAAAHFQRRREQDTKNYAVRLSVEDNPLGPHTIIVPARDMVVTVAGVLCFSGHDGMLIRAYAPGVWKEVYEVPKEGLL